MSDENGDEKKKKKKSLSLNMGDVSGKVVEKKTKKEAAPKETDKTEKKEAKEKCDCPDCSCKPNVDTIPFSEEEEPEIRLNVNGKQTRLEDIAQKDFLGWVENVMPMTKEKFKKLQQVDFSKYEEKKKLFDAVAKFHEDTLKADLKNRGYSGFPLI